MDPETPEHGRPRGRKRLAVVALVLLWIALGTLVAPHWVQSLVRNAGRTGADGDADLIASAGVATQAQGLPAEGAPSGAKEWKVFLGEPEIPGNPWNGGGHEPDGPYGVPPLDQTAGAVGGGWNGSGSGAPGSGPSQRRRHGPSGPPGTPVTEGSSARTGLNEQARAGALAKAGIAAPGRGQPQQPAPVGSTSFNWTYRAGGSEYECTTTISVAPGDGVRREAIVTTSDTQGHLLVSYGGTAFIDADGVTQVDSRNRPVSGPWAGQWSPDSFAIDEYGYVHSMDDYRRTGDGWVTTR